MQRYVTRAPQRPIERNVVCSVSVRLRVEVPKGLPPAQIEDMLNDSGCTEVSKILEAIGQQDCFCNDYEFRYVREADEHDDHLPRPLGATEPDDEPDYEVERLQAEVYQLRAYLQKIRDGLTDGCRVVDLDDDELLDRLDMEVAEEEPENFYATVELRTPLATGQVEILIDGERVHFGDFPNAHKWIELMNRVGANARISIVEEVSDA